METWIFVLRTNLKKTHPSALPLFSSCFVENTNFPAVDWTRFCVIFVPSEKLAFVSVFWAQVPRPRTYASSEREKSTVLHHPFLRKRHTLRVYRHKK